MSAAAATSAQSASSVSSSDGNSLFSEDEAKFMSESFHSADQFDPFTLGAPGFKVPNQLPHQRSLSPNSNPNPNPNSIPWSVNHSTSGSAAFNPFASAANHNPHHPRTISNPNPSGSLHSSRFSLNEMMPPHHLANNSHSSSPSLNSNPAMTSTPFYSADVDHHLSPHSSSSANSTSPPPPQNQLHQQQSFGSIHPRHNSVASAAWHHNSNYSQHQQHNPAFAYENNQANSWYTPNHSSPMYPNYQPSTAPPQPPSTAYGSQWAMEQLNFLQTESQKFGNRPRAPSSSASSNSNSVHSGEAVIQSQQQQQGGINGNASGVNADHFSQSLQMPSSMSDDHQRRHSLAGYVNANQHHQHPHLSSVAPPSNISSSTSSFHNGFSEANGMDMITPQITPQPTGNGSSFNSTSGNQPSSNDNPRDSEKDLSMLGLSFPSSHTFPSTNAQTNHSNPIRQSSPFSKRPRDDVEMRDTFGENKRGRSSIAEGASASWGNPHHSSASVADSSSPSDPSKSSRSVASRSKSPTKRSSNSPPSNDQRNQSHAQASASNSSSSVPTSWSLMSYSSSDSNNMALQGSDESFRPISIDPERGRGLIPDELEDYFWTRKFDKRQPHLEDLKRKETLENRQNGDGESSSTAKGKGRASNSDKEKPALLTEAEKKANHIASEQKRRANIRKGYEMLCNIIPPLKEALEKEKSRGGGARRGGMAFTGMVNVNSNSIKNNDDTDGDDKRGRKSKDGNNDQDDGLEIEGEKIDGRAGPRSEGIVLMKSVEYLRQELERHRALLARRSHAQVKLAKRYGADITLPETEADTSNSILNQSSPAPGATNGKNAPKGKAAGAKAKSAKSKANKKDPDDEAAPNANAKTNAKPASAPARNLRRRKTQEKEEQQAEAEDDEDEEEDDEGEGEGEEDDAMNQ